MFAEALEKIKIVAETLDDNDPEKVEMLNIEGDYSALIEWALTKRNDYLMQANGCKELAAKYTDRKKSFEGKADSMKDIIKIIMDSAGERSYKGIAGTASIKATPPKVIVLDEDKIPAEFFVTKVVLDKTLLKEGLKSGDEIEGAELSNGGETIAIRV